MDMSFSRTRRRQGRRGSRLLALAAASATVAAVTAATADAANPAFSCRASALRVDGLGVVNLEPSVANGPGAPCSTEANTNVELPPALAPLLGLGAIEVATTEAATGGSARTRIDAANVAPIVGGGLQVGLLEATAGYACVDGRAVPSGAARVGELRFLGVPVTLDAQGHASLLGLGDVWVQQRIAGAQRVTHRALTVRLLPTVLGGATVVLAEATASANGDCAASGGGGGTGGGGDTGGGGTGGGGGGDGTGGGGGGTGGDGTAGGSGRLPNGDCSTAATCFGVDGSAGSGGGTGGSGSGSSGNGAGGTGRNADGTGVIYSNDSSFQLPVTAFPGVTYACSIDGGDFRACAPPFRFDLADGSHTIRLRGTDQAGRSTVSTFRTFVDSRAPTAGTLYPVCRNTTTRRVTRRCARVASSWRVLRGRVTDPGPSSGIASVGVNLVRRTGGRCSVLTPARRLQAMPCTRAARVFVPAKVGARAFSRTTFGTRRCANARSRRARSCRRVGVRTQVARWSLKVPISAGRYTIRTTAVDRAGNQQTRFGGRSSIGLRLRRR